VGIFIFIGLALALALALGFPAAHAEGAGEPSALSLDVSLASFHTGARARHSLNQHNPGLGLTYSFSPDSDWSGSLGFYENSYRKTSAYALANWTPWHASLPGDFALAAGVTAGLVSGYTRAQCEVRPFAAGLLVRFRRAGAWGFNIVAAPRVRRGGSGFVGFQLVVPL
jgi:hypothetical protein